ncbi:MAG: peptide chain release factor-like protein [Verrucomicrobiota bacterium]
MEIPASLEARLRKLGIDEDSLEEKFIRGTGAGGQKINKTSSTVQLIHLPTRIEIQCQESRSQTTNRLRAREILCEQLEERARRRSLARKRARAKKRYEMRKPSKAQKEKRRRDKSARSDKKNMRRKPGQ